MMHMQAPTLPMQRASLEAKIEELIALLDLLDGDADLEPDNDNEPSLGWSDMESRYGCQADPHGEDDRELEDENDEDGGDTELNGDESDFSGEEGDYSVGMLPGGSGL